MPPRSLPTGAYRALSIRPILNEQAAPVLYELLGDSTEIGSADDNAIVLADPTVAPHHLAVRRANGREHLLVDLADRRRQRDLAWFEYQPGDVYWCPRHGSLEKLGPRRRCPQCKQRRGSLWLLRPLSPGDSFDVGRAFRATLVAQEEAPAVHRPAHHRAFLPPRDLLEAEEAPEPRLSIPEVELEIPVADLPTDDSNLWHWKPEGAPFSIFLHQRVNRLITQHARRNSEEEVGGILLGDVRRDPRGQLYVVVNQALEAEFASGTRGHITFTQKTWLKIHQTHEARFPEMTIVGWYHTHPGWTIFLSEWDLFIHRNFFKQPWQIALVLDPSLHRAGFFVWDGGEVSNPQQPVAPFRLIELEGWGDGARPRVRIRLTDSALTA